MTPTAVQPADLCRTRSRDRRPARAALALIVGAGLGLSTLAQTSAQTPAQTPASTRTACSRPLAVPVAEIGEAVTVRDGQVGGIFPELLRESAAKEGCELRFTVVPRARQELLYETGQADLLVPARRSARRDRFGVFVPMIRSRAALVTLAPAGPAHPASSSAATASAASAVPTATPPVEPASLADLLARRALRVVVIRGYDYGEPYQRMMRALERERRLVRVTDPLSMARVLDERIADVAVVTPTILVGALRQEPKWQPLQARLRSVRVDEFGWGESGLYVATGSSLPEAERERLREWMERLARSGAAWREFERHYPDDRLSETVRPQ